MSVASVAKNLTALCRQGKFLEAIDKHYGANAVSIEPIKFGEAKAPRTRGIKTIRKMTESWADSWTVQKVDVAGPFVGDGKFALHMQLAVTPKGSRKQLKMSEMALYTVEDDKIVQAEFFYAPPA